MQAKLKNQPEEMECNPSMRSSSVLTFQSSLAVYVTLRNHHCTDPQNRTDPCLCAISWIDCFISDEIITNFLSFPTAAHALGLPETIVLILHMFNMKMMNDDKEVTDGG